MVAIEARPAVEHHGDAGDHRDQRPGEGPERGDARLRVPGRAGPVCVSRVHAELVPDPVPDGLRAGNVRLPHVLLPETP